MSDPIQHVVVLLLENRSFDQMLGCLSVVYDGLDGIDPAHARANSLPLGGTSARWQTFAQQPTMLRQMPWRKPDIWDPHHEVQHVRVQLEGPAGHPERMGGFVADFVEAYPGSTDEARQYIMSYFPLDFLPALHALARDFTVCDRWFSSLPGPTWPNRFFALSGTASGRVDMPDDGTYHLDIPGYFHQRQFTIFDRLNENGIHWKSYFHDIPQSWVLSQPRLPQNVARYFYIDEFFEDTRGRPEDFPQFCYIEPDFLGFQQNDDHPPHDVMKGEKLIADVYNSIRSNDELWHSTLLVIFFDEHGGFYDHVYPPNAVPPDPPDQQKQELLSEMLAKINPWHKSEEAYSFNQLGVRVPALLVSPWVRRGVAKVGGRSPVFDHTSLLKYLTEKWNLGPLGLRTLQAESIGILIAESIRPDGNTISKIVIPSMQAVDPDLEDAAFGITEHDKGLLKLATFLKTMLWLDPKAAAAELGVETTPRVFVAISYLLQGLTFLLTWHVRRIGSWALRWDRRPQASIGEPDKIHTDTVSPRDDTALFMMRRKHQALSSIGADIREGGTKGNHAIRTLAGLTGRPFHKEDHARAAEWLAAHGSGP
jgi:phospholipase C